MKKKKTWIIAAIAIVVIIAVCWTLSGTKANSQVDFVTEKTRTGSVSNSITATGTIEPVTEVEVGTQVSGIIDKIYVDYNSIVKQGEIIAEMDKVTLLSDLQSAQATYNGAKAEYEYQKKLYERNKTLHTFASSVSKVINAKNALTILNYFLFEIHGSTLTITACDGENTLCGRIPIMDVEGEGEFCIDARKVVELLRVMPEQELQFDVNDDNLSIEMTHPNGSYRFMGLSGAEYPRLARPESDEDVTFTVKGSTILRGLDYTAFATGTELIRPQMMGVYWDIKPQSLTFVATDTRKLVKFEDRSYQPGVEGSFILPNKSTNVFRSVFGKEDEVKVTLVPAQGVTFETDTFTFESRLVKGKFPEYERVIPKSNPYDLTVNRQLFTTAVRRVSLFVDEGHGLIKFRVTPDLLTVKAADNEYNTSGEETLSATYTGQQDLIIGFSSSYLLELASVLWTDDIIFRLADKSRPAVIVPSEDKPDTTLTMILMPMNISEF